MIRKAAGRMSEPKEYSIQLYCIHSITLQQEKGIIVKTNVLSTPRLPRDLTPIHSSLLITLYFVVLK